MKYVRLLLLLSLLCNPALGEQVTKVGLVPVDVEGSYKPLTSQQATQLLFEGLKSQNSRAELSLLEGVSSNMPQQQALQAAKAQGVDMIIWGQIRFRKSSFTSRGDRYYRGRLKVAVTTEANLKSVWVPKEKLVFSQPTIVTSSKQTLSWTTSDTSHFSEEQLMAANSMKDVAEALVHVVRRKHQAGWFQVD